MPPDAAGDAQLAAEMCREERFLLGMQSTSNARPINAAAMELVRWLLLDKPRPQMAFCFLQLKPIFEERRRRAARRLSCMRQRWHCSTSSRLRSMPLFHEGGVGIGVRGSGGGSGGGDGYRAPTDIVLPPTHRAPIVGGTLEAVGYAYM